MASLHYRPEIDGLRAFAVVAVIAFHLWGDWIPGGFLGVDVFFVISGYLITSIIATELQTGSFSFRRFWARRIRRIIPAMLLVTLAAAVLSSQFTFPPDRPHLGIQATSALLSGANVCFWRTMGNYWGSDAETSPFLHLWSLSVEEQFYLFYPVLLFIIRRWTTSSRRWIVGVLLTIFTFSLTLFVAGTLMAPTATFYLLPTRAWELAAGCVLAFAPHSNAYSRRALVRFAQWIGLVLIVTSFFFAKGIGLGALMAAGGAILVVGSSHWQCGGFATSLLASRPAVCIGRLSYSLYLWHWPLIVFAFNSDPTRQPQTILLVIVLTTLLSVATWHLIENPARRPTTSVMRILGAYVFVLSITVSMTLRPAPVIDTSGWNKTSWFGRFYDLSPTTEMDATFRQLVRNMDVPERTSPADAYLNGGIIDGLQSGDPEIVLLGDSHGVMWSDVVKEVAHRVDAKVALISMNGVLPFFQDQSQWFRRTTGLTVEQQWQYDRSRMDLIRKWKPKVVIVACRWSTVSVEQCLPTLTFLNEHAQQTLLLEQPPELQRIGNRNALEYAIWHGAVPHDFGSTYATSENREQVEATRQLLEELTQRYSHCSIVRLREQYTNYTGATPLSRRQATVTLGRNVVYVDDDHLSTFGSHMAMALLHEAISKSLTRARTQSPAPNNPSHP